MKNKNLSWIFGLFLLMAVLISGCQNSNQQVKFDAKPVIKYVSKKGLIEDKGKWQEAIHQTKDGAKIHNLKDLNKVLKEIENENYPSLVHKQGFVIINVPSFYSLKKISRSKYSTKLRKDIKQTPADQPIILNFSNNTGDDYYIMISGLADLIPNGTLFTEVDNKQHEHPVSLQSKKIVGD